MQVMTVELMPVTVSVVSDQGTRTTSGAEKKKKEEEEERSWIMLPDQSCGCFFVWHSLLPLSFYILSSLTLFVIPPPPPPPTLLFPFSCSSYVCCYLHPALSASLSDCLPNSVCLVSGHVSDTDCQYTNKVRLSDIPAGLLLGCLIA